MLSALPIARHQRALDQYLRDLLSPGEPGLLYRMIRYHLGWEDDQGRYQDAGGKSLRGSLCLLACEAVGGNPEQALPAAAAVELAHNFSLIHDDVQDQDLQRRHRPTVWSIWGQAQAINAGDALHVLARLQVLELAGGIRHSEIAVEAARILDERTLEMVEGQTLDIAFEDTLDVNVSAYIHMIEKKSGALFDCALNLGALTGRADSPTAQQWGRIGRRLGTAFQIRDDVLGIWGEETRTGKPKRADIRRRKKSLPIVYALNEASDAIRDQLRSIYSRADVTDADDAFVLQSLDELRARDYCQLEASNHKQTALAALDELGATGGPSDELKSLSEFLVERDY